MFIMNLGKNLKWILKEKDLSLAQIGRATGIATQTLHNWVADQNPRDISQVKKVADYLELSMDTLCFGDGKKIEEQNPIKKFDEEIHAGIYEVVLRPIKKSK